MGMAFGREFQVHGAKPADKHPRVCCIVQGKAHCNCRRPESWLYALVACLVLLVGDSYAPSKVSRGLVRSVGLANGLVPQALVYGRVLGLEQGVADSQPGSFACSLNGQVLLASAFRAPPLRDVNLTSTYIPGADSSCQV